MKTNRLKIALPKGRLLGETAALLQRAGWGLDGYHEQARFYYIESKTSPRFSARVFHEKDIPTQVAIGNYDLGICGSDWLEELMVKYPSSALMKVDLPAPFGPSSPVAPGGTSTLRPSRARIDP